MVSREEYAERFDYYSGLEWFIVPASHYAGAYEWSVKLGSMYTGAQFGGGYRTKWEAVQGTAFALGKYLVRATEPGEPPWYRRIQWAEITWKPMLEAFDNIIYVALVGMAVSLIEAQDWETIFNVLMENAK